MFFGQNSKSAEFVALTISGQNPNLKEFQTIEDKKSMTYITQLIYLKEGQEVVFHQFENVAIPIIKKYNGRLLVRIRPDENSYIEYSIEKPYEVHFVEFKSEQDFKNFMQDDERKKFLHLKEQSMKASILIQGVKV